LESLQLRQKQPSKKYVDKDGHAAWLVGALVGAGMDIAVQTVIEGKSISPYRRNIHAARE
jgi:hypothetical protein